MRIAYPYNEILPRKRAHDVFIFQECAALADLGWDLTLLVGKGSQTKKELLYHYKIHSNNTLHIQSHYLIRKNNPFGLSWNLPFFMATQRSLRKLQPDWVIFSVRKQASYHLRRKIKNVKYLYEVHELSRYPDLSKESRSVFQKERALLSQADLITVTTQVLKELLQCSPYNIKVPIEIVPLAVNIKPLPPPSFSLPLQLMYVGQLYDGQGIALLITALSKVENVHLKILGGTPFEICQYLQLAHSLNVASRIEFLGYVSPPNIANIVETAHAFIAPFEKKGRMPYVAHTKLLEYAEWGRPILAPRLPVVEEHFQNGAGVLLFEPDDPDSMAECIGQLLDKSRIKQLQTAIETDSGRFCWEKRAQRYSEILDLF